MIGPEPINKIFLISVRFGILYKFLFKFALTTIISVHTGRKTYNDRFAKFFTISAAYKRNCRLVLQPFEILLPDTVFHLRNHHLDHPQTPHPRYMLDAA